MFEDAVINADGVLEIKSEDLKGVSNISDIRLIDVRRPDEFDGELGHIEGAELLTLEKEFPACLDGFDKKSVYVFVCRSGVRSSKAAQMAKEKGFDQAFNLGGGMVEWNRKGFKTK